MSYSNLGIPRGTSTGFDVYGALKSKEGALNVYGRSKDCGALN